MADSFSVTKIGKPEFWLIEAANSIGIDITGLTHEVTNHFESHSIKKHGNRAAEEARGQLVVTSADIALIPDIIKSPDYALIGIKRHGILIAYSKKLDEGTAFYYEEVLNSKRNKALRSKTMFKKMGTVNEQTFLNIITANLHTDISNAKIVVGAGGQPGEEA
jgi:hypothetical protein